jgi:hypothetical protein
VKKRVAGRRLYGELSTRLDAAIEALRPFGECASVEGRELQPLKLVHDADWERAARLVAEHEKEEKI